MVGPWCESQAQEMKQLGPGRTALFLPRRSWSSQPDPLQAERGYCSRDAGDASPGLAVQAAGPNSLSRSTAACFAVHALGGQGWALQWEKAGFERGPGGFGRGRSLESDRLANCPSPAGRLQQDTAAHRGTYTGRTTGARKRKDRLHRALRKWSILKLFLQLYNGAPQPR